MRLYIAIPKMIHACRLQNGETLVNQSVCYSRAGKSIGDGG
jgi:hypothetical protein